MRAAFYFNVMQLQLSLNAIYVSVSCHLFWPQNLYRNCKSNKFAELPPVLVSGPNLFVYDVPICRCTKPHPFSESLEKQKTSRNIIFEFTKELRWNTNY